MESCVSDSDRVLSPSMYIRKCSFINRWLSPVIDADADTGCGSGRRYIYRQARGSAICVPDPSERRQLAAEAVVMSCVSQHTHAHTLAQQCTFA